MIIGIEFLCDRCVSQGPQTTRAFTISTDQDGDPTVTVRCHFCKELVRVVFVPGLSAYAMDAEAL